MLTIFILGLLSFITALIADSSKEDGALGLFFGLLVGLLVSSIGFNFDYTKASTFRNAESVCAKSGSKLKLIQHDGDFKCVNGAEFDRDVLKEVKGE